MSTIQSSTAARMISEFYSDAIRRCIAIYIAKDISEIQNTLILESKALSKEIIYVIKNQVLFEILKTEKVKQILLFGLEGLMLKQDDVLAEILRQYDIHNTEDSTYYHDKMKIIFADYIDIFKALIKQEKTDLLYLHLKDCL